jgi:hypothetical protein
MTGRPRAEATEWREDGEEGTQSSGETERRERVRGKIEDGQGEALREKKAGV